ncbi:MAG: hypothetical protein Q8R83_07725 [Legionellaceae bacterium]|nr:hypothetical protein [Legionellaceae bacterium]
MFIQPPNEVNRHNSEGETQYFNELKEFLRACDFIENRDYLFKKEGVLYTNIHIQGKSTVLRALLTLPLVANQKALSDLILSIIRRLVTEITERECIVTDLRLVREETDKIFNFIKEEIETIHAKFIKHSTVIESLNRDLSFIKQLINAPIFGETKYLLAFCSLIKAMSDENTLQTQAKSYLFSKGASGLSTEYANLARKIKNMFPKMALFTQENLSIIYVNSVKNRVLTPPPPLSVQERAITVIQEEPVKKKSRFRPQHLVLK